MVVRSAGVYLFLLVAFRVAGKRQLGQLAAFDLVVLVVTSNVLQNAVIGSDNPLGGVLVGASVIISLNWVVARLPFRRERLEKMVENVPTALVKHGQVLHTYVDREHMSIPELRAALRKEGITTKSEVRYAILEEDGHGSVIPWGPVPA